MVGLKCPEQDLKMLMVRSSTIKTLHSSLGHDLCCTKQWGSIPRLGLNTQFVNRAKKNNNSIVSIVTKTSGNVPKSKQPRVVLQHKYGKRGKSAQQAICTYTLAKTNPFLGAVNGVRAPDEFGYPTATAVMRGATSMATDATGYAVRAFLPTTQYYSYTPASNTSGTVTWSGGSSAAPAQYTALSNLASVARIVGWGVRITTELSLTSASGHLWVAHVPFDAYNNYPWSAFPSSENGVAALPLSEKFSLAEAAEAPIVVSGRSFDDGCFRFRDVLAGSAVATTASIESTNGWCAIIVFCSAGANTSVTALNVEFVYHLEYLQNGQTLYGFIDTLPGAYDPVALQQSAIVESMAPAATIDTAVNTVEKAAATVGRVMNSAYSVMSSIAPAMAMAGRMAASRGYFRDPSMSPFKPMIKYR